MNTKADDEITLEYIENEGIPWKVEATASIICSPMETDSLIGMGGVDIDDLFEDEKALFDILPEDFRRRIGGKFKHFKEWLKEDPQDVISVLLEYGKPFLHFYKIAIPIPRDIGKDGSYSCSWGYYTSRWVCIEDLSQIEAELASEIHTLWRNTYDRRKESEQKKRDESERPGVQA